jgi:LuxR family maltose regulon positive regulatory protein
MRATVDTDFSFGALLRQFRVAAELSQEALAERAHMSARGISDLERGVRTKPYQGTIRQLADALQLGAAEREALENAARRLRDPAVPPDAQGVDSPDETLLTSKLAVPLTHRQLVDRPHLRERLEAGLRGPLTLLAAPAGSGKTTLLSAWWASSAARDVRVAWVSLDERDNDLVRFRRYVLAALDRAGVDVGDECRSLLQLPRPAPGEVVLTAFLNAVNVMTTDVVLILDDFHVIDSEPLLNGLSFLLEHLPPQLHFVLSTRADPPLPLARLRAAGQVIELRAADLRFGRDEAAAFLTEVMGLELTPDQIEALERRTEGWIAGLQLAALSLQGRPDTASDFIVSFTGSHRHVIDYLTDEVLAQLPKATQAFLLHTSILERLSAPLCAFVMEETTAADAALASRELLEDLERHNLFVVALDEQREWYRYHHLFAEALRHRFRQLEPERVAEARLRASTWFERRGLLSEASVYALDARSFERAAHLIERVAPSLIGQSANQTLWRLMDRLPDPVMEEHPTLCLIKAWGLLDEGYLERGERWLDVAERAVTSDEPGDHAGGLQAEIDAARAFAASVRGDTAEVVARAEQALRDLNRDSFLTRGLTGLALGRAYMVEGELGRAAESYAEAAAIVRRTNNSQAVMRAMFGQSRMEAAQGHLRRAMETCRQAIAWSAERGHPYSGVGMIYLALADMLRERNELDPARQLATEGAALCKRVEYELDAQIFPRRVLALIEEASGHLDVALQIVHEADALISREEPIHSMASWHLCEAHLRLLQGNLPAAITCVETAEREQERERGPLSSLAFMRGHEQVSLVPFQVMIAQGQAEGDPARLQQALMVLKTRREEADGKGAVWLQIKTRVLEALAHRARGDGERARSALQQALELGQPEGYVRAFADEGAPLAALLHEITMGEGMREYVATLISAARSAL